MFLKYIASIKRIIPKHIFWNQEVIDNITKDFKVFLPC